MNYLLAHECYKHASAMPDGYFHAVKRADCALFQLAKCPFESKNSIYYRYDLEMLLKKIYFKGGFGVTKDKKFSENLPYLKTVEEFLNYFLNKYNPSRPITKELPEEVVADALAKLSHMPYFFSTKAELQGRVSCLASICTACIYMGTDYENFKSRSRARDHLGVALQYEKLDSYEISFLGKVLNSIQ